MTLMAYAGGSTRTKSGSSGIRTSTPRWSGASARSSPASSDTVGADSLGTDARGLHKASVLGATLNVWGPDESRPLRGFLPAQE